MNFRSFAIAALLCCVSFVQPAAVRAETFNTCKDFITTLPVTIATQGVWCLKSDLATSITGGAAVTIAANNVTIDCNGFKIGGLAAGDSSSAAGIYANNRQNATVRHCNIRGFYYGIDLISGGGHLVEDNRLDNNLQMGILVQGSDNLIRRNLVFATGGAPGSNGSIGIQAYADVIDNTVSGVFATTTDTYPYGIYVMSNESEISGNRIRGLVVGGAGHAYGLAVTGDATTVSGNRIANRGSIAGTGLYSGGNSDFCLGNTVTGYTTAYTGCAYATGNLP